MGSSPKYLVIYHAVSAGQNGSSLGCDEEDIVMIVFLVLDREENKVSRKAGKAIHGTYQTVWKKHLMWT